MQKLIVALAVCALVLCAPVHDARRIAMINADPELSWTAGVSKKFSGTSDADWRATLLQDYDSNRVRTFPHALDLGMTADDNIP
ncbi:hypothetical protein KIPB_003710, partial [Kipferlia bialata]|eukprot:g3710.t1